MPNRARRLRGRLRAQSGAALILFMTVLIMGVAWFTVGALGKAAPTAADRDARTGFALGAAKKALLAYVALKAADSTENFPGRLPCPESLGQKGTAAEGLAAPVVAPSFPTCSSIGRLPWETLGVDQVRDGYGEPLWYAVTTGVWALVNSGTNLTINPGTANSISYNGSPNSVVAVIIAPGPAVNSLSASGAPPPGCSAVNQQVNRYAVPLVVSKFLECGNATGSYITAGIAPWSNDRTVSITATEVMDAIAGAVADRMQRQVAAALSDWRTNTSASSWGESFMPYASTFSSAAPPTNNMCGNSGVTEGMPPTATVVSGTCDTNWSSGNASGLGALLSSSGCTSTSTRLRCSFTVILGGLATPTITATAPNVAYAFRSFDPSTQITISVNGGTYTPAVVQNFSGSVSGGTGSATISFQVKFPLLSVFDTVRVRITHPVDALLADTRTAWFLDNGWDRYSYYAISQATAASPSGVCSAPGNAACLTVNGMTTTNDKRIVLILVGHKLSTQTWPSTNVANYLEGGNATTGDGVYDAKTVTSTFNDRVAACPFQSTSATGSVATICN